MKLLKRAVTKKNAAFMARPRRSEAPSAFDGYGLVAQSQHCSQCSSGAICTARASLTWQGCCPARAASSFMLSLWTR